MSILVQGIETTATITETNVSVAVQSTGNNITVSLSNVAGDKYHTTSNSTLTLAANGTVSLTTNDLGLDYSIAQTVIIAYDDNNHCHGEVVSYNGSTGLLVVNLKNKTGSGTYSSWQINLDGAVGVQGPAGQGVPVGGTTGQTLVKIDNTNYNTTWVSIPSVARMSSGYWYTYPSSWTSSVTPVLNSIYFTPIILPSAQTLSKLGTYVSTGITSGTIRVGLYTSDSLDRPSTLIAESGSQAATATGGVSYTLPTPISLSAGLYFIGVVTQVASASIPRTSPQTNTTLIPFGLTSVVPTVNPTAQFWALTNQTGSMPVTITPANLSYAVLGLFGVIGV